MHMSMFENSITIATIESVYNNDSAILFMQVAKFVQCVEEPSFYGYSNETLESLMLSILPSNEHICGRVQQAQQSCAMFEDTSLCILENILHKLCNLLGFHIILVSNYYTGKRKI